MSRERIDNQRLFVLLDFDRTLADTDGIKALFDASIERFPESKEAAMKQFLMVASRQDLLLSGASELLDSLKSCGIAYGILTYGELSWQQLKLRATRLDLEPHLIVNNKLKGKIIAGWRSGGEYCLPRELGGGRYQKLVLVDDRLYSFAEAPADLIKFYCGELSQDELPAGITKINNLTSIKNYLIKR